MCDEGLSWEIKRGEEKNAKALITNGEEGPSKETGESPWRFP
jgi:hypothetical protein